MLFLTRLKLAWHYWRDAKLRYSWRTSWILSAGRSLPWLP